MKKIIALLITLAMTLPLASCRLKDSVLTPPPTNADSEETTTAETPETPPAEVVREDTYFKITKPSPTTFAYEIYDPKGNVILSSAIDRQLNLSMLGDSIVVVTIGINEPTDDGITFFCDVQSGRISEAYSSLMLYTEDVVISRKRSADGMTVVAKPLFGNEVYVEYLLEDIASTPYPIRSFEFVNGMLCLEYVPKWDGNCSVVIPVLEPDGNYFADYGSIVALANDLRTVMRYEADQLRFQELFGITDTQQGEWFDDLNSSLLDFYGSPDLRFTEVKYAVKDLNGDGIFELILIRDYGGNYEVIAIFSTVDGKPFLLDHFWNRKKCYIGHDGLIYICGSNGADSNSRTMCRIAEGGASLEVIDEFGLDGHEWIDGVAVQTYYKLENGEKISISEEEYQELSMKYPYPYAYLTKDSAMLEVVREESLARQASAKQAILDVLYERATVYDTATGEFLYLKDCKTPTTQTRLGNFSHCLYSYTDLDGDQVSELVIDCGDKLILRYFEGRVYLYSFMFREMNRLYTDGSYLWNRDDKTFTYGVSQLTFDGATLKIRALWKIVNDRGMNGEYYLGEKQVTRGEVMEYMASCSTTEVEYSHLPLPWEPKITPEEAWEIANAYWENTDGQNPDSYDPYLTYRIVLQADPRADIGAYHFVCVKEYYASPDGYLAGKNDVYFARVYQCLLVDAMTGESSLCENFDDSDGK